MGAWNREVPLYNFFFKLFNSITTGMEYKYSNERKESPHFQKLMKPSLDPVEELTSYPFGNTDTNTQTQKHTCINKHIYMYGCTCTCIDKKEILLSMYI